MSAYYSCFIIEVNKAKYLNIVLFFSKTKFQAFEVGESAS